MIPSLRLAPNLGLDQPRQSLIPQDSTIGQHYRVHRSSGLPSPDQNAREFHIANATVSKMATPHLHTGSDQLVIRRRQFLHHPGILMLEDNRPSRILLRTRSYVVDMHQR